MSHSSFMHFWVVSSVLIEFVSQRTETMHCSHYTEREDVVEFWNELLREDEMISLALHFAYAIPDKCQLHFLHRENK